MSSSQERAAKTFVERHSLWSEEQFEAAARAERLIEERKLEVVRLSFPDQHGILRGKQIVAGDAAKGAEARLDVVQIFFPNGGAGAVLDPPSLPQGAEPARRSGLRLRRRPR